MAALPAELVDRALWPLCATFDGEQQRCTCWWGARHREFIDSGGGWPGGRERELADLVEMHTRYPCREPWDESVI
jgi:hypothetical protein